jgi:hypothetical protein
MTKKPYESPTMEVYELPETLKLLSGTPNGVPNLFGDPDDPADLG